MSNEPKIPKRPTKPHILSQLVGNLSDVELQSIPAMKAKWVADMEAYRVQMAEYTSFHDNKIKECRDQAEKEFGTKGHPKADLLWAKAWDLGHSNGLQDVYIYYSDLVELVL